MARKDKPGAQTSRWHKLSALRAKICFTAGLQNHSIGDHTVADMKTSLTDEQLADPAIAEADRILNTCQHFGFCTAGCPTYVLLHDENDGPRGRIDLIKEMLESQRAPTPRTVAHIDRCLSCMSCMTTCAVKVDYMHLVDTARAHIEDNYRRPPGQRIARALLGRVCRARPVPDGASLGRLVRPFSAALPPFLRSALRLIPERRQAGLRQYRYPPAANGSGASPCWRVACSPCSRRTSTTRRYAC